MNIKDIKTAIRLLESSRSKDGRFPPEIFYASAKLFGESCLELCIFTTDNCGIGKVFLSERPDDDPYWPKLLHIPGVRKLVTDTDESSVLRVIAETPFDIDLREIQYCSSSIIRNKRGTEFSDLRWVEISDIEDMERFFYPVDKLPNNIIKFQYKLIYSAYECYWRHKNG